MELDWSVEREGDASLVGVRVRNDGAVPRRVRIESRLDGPVLPPRRGGVAAAGWDAAGVTAVIGPGESEAFGFAALAEQVEPPVEIVDVESVNPSGKDDPVTDGDDPAARGDGRAADGDDRARTALRSLEEHRPPRRAVAEVGETDRGGGGSGRGGEESERDENETGSDGPDARPNGLEARPNESAGDAETVEPAGGDGSDRSTAAGPSPGGTHAEVDAWFAAVEGRIDRAERLTDADLATATATVEEAGGLDAVEGLDERVAADAERLKRIRDRAAALAERAEASDVPAGALEALS